MPIKHEKNKMSFIRRRPSRTPSSPKFGSFDTPVRATLSLPEPLSAPCVVIAVPRFNVGYSVHLIEAGPLEGDMVPVFLEHGPLVQGEAIRMQILAKEVQRICINTKVDAPVARKNPQDGFWALILVERYTKN